MERGELLTMLNELRNDYEYMIRRMQMSLSNVNWILNHLPKEEKNEKETK